MGEYEFTGEVWFWRGPAPWFFVSVPVEEAEDIAAESTQVSYGWGMIPVDVRVGNTSFYTALWPKDQTYVVPLKAAIRKAESIVEGDVVEIGLTLRRDQA